MDAVVGDHMTCGAPRETAHDLCSAGGLGHARHVTELNDVAGLGQTEAFAGQRDFGAAVHRPLRRADTGDRVAVRDLRDFVFARKKAKCNDRMIYCTY